LKRKKPNLSWQASFVKKIIKLLFSGWSHGTVDEQRQWQEKMSRFLLPPATVHCQPVDVNGVPGEWVTAPAAGHGGILYLHGGGYTVGSTNTHRGLVARISNLTTLPVLLIDYRLAPEHPFPAALEDAVTAYRWLLAQGIDHSRIVIAGDSAGGGLALATLVALREAGDQLPAGVFCISPWTDLTGCGDSIRSREEQDPVLSMKSLQRDVNYYAGGQDLLSPFISPIFADLAGLPPLFIQVGTDEILLDDSRRIAENAQKAGVDVTLEVYEGMFHVFHMVPNMPETKKAMLHIGYFISRILGKGG